MHVYARVRAMPSVASSQVINRYIRQGVGYIPWHTRKTGDRRMSNDESELDTPGINARSAATGSSGGTSRTYTD